ncbi:Clavaminate synthase-like protein [Jaminaea rosea]|uniref:Clavaminate synthase-like protein n=1 Tax=Jaminaea rosea TaxID=1569628 RepID=A0A316URK5_9BASI|nr:Clavaminate synthase-like protein [Jaminaea rosea]PWN27950.1 Clavaminate synthase-like protein [Jaminaea rosea]
MPRASRGYQPWIAYQGYEPATGDSIARECVDDLTPQRLWDSYISKRRPCIIKGFPRDEQWKADAWRDLTHLSHLAGHVPVKVEPIHPKLGHFGTAAKRTTVPFGDYVASLRSEGTLEGGGEAADGQWYLTTQYDEEDDDDEGATSEELGDLRDGNERKRKRSSSGSSASSSSSVFSSTSSLDTNSHPVDSLLGPTPLDPPLPSPTHALAHSFPPKPTLMGNLVLQQTNLWLGASTQGKSSGLHHDFHDNLYALIRGRKRFVLFPPTAFKFLHPRGTVERVHHNGLIEYTPRPIDPEEGEVLHVDDPRSSRLPLRPDGLPAGEAARWRLYARKAALRRVEEDAAASSGEGAVPRGMRKGKGRMTQEQEEAESAIEEARREAWAIARLEGEVEGENSEEEEDSGEEDGDDGSLFARLAGMESDSEEEREDSEDDEEGGYDPELQMALQALARRAAQGDMQAAEALRSLVQDDDDDEEEEDAEEEEEEDDSEELQGALLEEIDSDDDNDDNDSSLAEDDGARRSPPLVIPRNHGHNLPGGLRRDDGDDEGSDFFGEDDGPIGQFDDFAANAELLLADDDDEEGGGQGGIGEGGDAEAEEEELRAMAALRGEVMRRMARAAGGASAASRRGRGAGRSVHGSRALMRIQQVGASDDEDEDDGEEDLGNLDSDDDEDEEEDDAAEEERLERLLAAHRQGLDIDDDFHELDSEDDDEGDDEDEEDDEDDSEDFDEANLDEGDAVLAALAAQARGQGYQDEDDQEDESEPDDSDSDLTTPTTTSSSAPSDQNEPLSFSLIPPAVLHAHFGLDDSLASPAGTSSPTSLAGKEPRSKLYPLRGKRPLPGCPQPLVAELQEGEMLFLPAGWWHEVTSQASSQESNGSATEDADARVHMALNFWFHPPDNLLPSDPPALNGVGEEKRGSGKKKGRRAQQQAGSGSGSGSATAQNGEGADGGGFAQPYRDVEVWDCLREEVKRLVSEAIAKGDEGRKADGTEGEPAVGSKKRARRT